MAVTGGEVFLRVQVYQTLSDLPVSQNLIQSLNQTISWGNGSGAEQYNLLHVKKYSLAGSTQSIDLTAIVDLSGATVNMARVRAMAFVNLATTSGHNLTVDTTVSNGFKGFNGASGSKRIVYASLSTTKPFYNADVVVDPYSVGGSVGAVTSGTSKVITLDPGANTFTVWAFILGCSATS
jgi:hypothetical protein